MTKSWESYLKVEPKKPNNTFDDRPCHATKTKHNNQNKGHHIEPHFYLIICLGLVETNLKHKNELLWNPKS
jgi:hypothetical protein